MNTEYLLWFGAVVAVAGGALLWLAIGGVPEIPPEPGTREPDPAALEPDRAALEADPAVHGPDPADADPDLAAGEPDPTAEAFGPSASELAGEDGVAQSA